METLFSGLVSEYQQYQEETNEDESEDMDNNYDSEEQLDDE